MNPILSVWRLARRFERTYFALALALEAMAGVAVCRGQRLDLALIQFELGARELVNLGRINSTFLPIGYPALLGWAEIAGTRFLHLRADTAVFTMQVMVMVLVVALARFVLRQFGSPRFATTGALIVGLDPQLMTFVKSVTDTDLTVVVLLALAGALLCLRARPTATVALVAGVVLAAAVHVRPNLLLMVALLPWALGGRALPVAAKLAGVALGSAAVTYVLFAVVVHGKPFYPHNGPYNLYAGFNPYTSDALARSRNAENSIMPAMRDRGLPVTLDWGRQPDDRDRKDPRDERYLPFFEQETRAFIRANPGLAIQLSWQKLQTFCSESFGNYEHRGTLRYSVTLLVKIVCLLILPLWGVLLIRERLHGGLGVGVLFAGMALLYVLPFALTNSDPRFRTPLEALLLLDVMRMFLGSGKGGERRSGGGGVGFGSEHAAGTK